MLNEFRDFLLRGNIVELAVACVMGVGAVFFFVVKPVNALMNRLRSPVEEGMPDEERRHRELLAALGQIRAAD
jgi:large-conductance mechanosensitive channel